MKKNNTLLIGIYCLMVITIQAQAYKDDFVQSYDSQKKHSLHEQKVAKVAKELQDVLATKMLEQMFEGQKPDKLFGGGEC